MPPVIIGAAIAGAGSLAGAAVSANATNKASQAASNAASQNAQIQQQQYAQTRADLSPFMQSGYTAQNALMQRLGLAPAAQAPVYQDKATGVPDGALGTGKTGPATVPTSAPMTATPSATPYSPGAPAMYLPGTTTATSGGLTDAQAQQLLQDRPDVMAEYQRASSTADRNSPVFTQKGLDSPTNYARYWFSNMGGNSSYTPQGTGQTQAATPPQPAANAPSAIPGQTFTAANNGGLGDRATLARPTFSQAEPTFTDPTFGASPTTADYVDPSKFTTSPGYQFRLDQGLRASNAAFGAKGLLKSDASIKALNDYAQGQASSEYGNWFSQGMQRFAGDAGQYNTDRATTLGQFNNDRATSLAQFNQNRNVFNTNYNTDTARYDQNFNSDRGYNTDQYNTYTGNLFNLSNMGQNAAAGVGNAGANYAAATTANNNNLASVQGNAAIAGANSINGAINSGLQAYGMYSNPFSVGATSGGFGTQGYMSTASPAVQSSMAGLY